jgi:tryptophan synthase alpha chain
MDRISNTFSRLRQTGSTGFVPFSLAGFPTVSASKDIFTKLSEGDILEFGYPFSDPVADGPMIQFAASQAIKNGISMDSALEMIGELRSTTQTPIIFFSYFNPIHKYGRDRFVSKARECGVDGLLIVDLPFEETRWLKPQAEKQGLAWIYLVAPTTPDHRIKRMDDDGSGFIYYVSVLGVTGARTDLPPEVASRCEQIRSMIKLPLVVGFGISNPAQAAWLKPHVDGVVVGSAILEKIKQNKLDELNSWMKEMKTALA